MSTPEESASPTDNARAVVLARHQPPNTQGCNPGGSEGIEGTVHVVALAVGEHTGGDQVAALCGMRIRPEEMHTVPPGQTHWCPRCFLAHLTTPATPDPDPGAWGSCTVGQPMAAVAGYRKLGWPILLRGEDVVLDLDTLGAVAVITPTSLATLVCALLTRRRCPPTVLAHPALPHHQVLLAGERYPVPLGWPPEVHRITGTLPLPPTLTARGPVCWIHCPQPTGLRLCREFDVVAALHATGHDPPPACGPFHF
ncbi:MAG: hypothetical protein ACRDQG_01950 [Pseudonocardiaceae bacterium]